LPAEQIGGGYLRRENAFRIARATPVYAPAFHPARKEWRNAVEMGGQREHRGSGCQDVHPPVVDRLLDDSESQLPQIAGKPPAGLTFPPGRRIDIDERPREADDVDGRHYLIHASSSVRVSVRESRYLTMTGVARDRPHSVPLPAVTARAPGTTTAPSGTMSG
jgi:hypothetical protein